MGVNCSNCCSQERGFIVEDETIDSLKLPIRHRSNRKISIGLILYIMYNLSNIYVKYVEYELIQRQRKKVKQRGGHMIKNDHYQKRSMRKYHYHHM